MKMMSHKMQRVWVPKLSYEGEPSNQEQAHWAVTRVRKKFFKPLRFLGSSVIAVSIVLKNTDINLGLSQRRG